MFSLGRCTLPAKETLHWSICNKIQDEVCRIIASKHPTTKNTCVKRILEIIVKSDLRQSKIKDRVLSKEREAVLFIYTINPRIPESRTFRKAKAQTVDSKTRHSLICRCKSILIGELHSVPSFLSRQEHTTRVHPLGRLGRHTPPPLPLTARLVAHRFRAAVIGSRRRNAMVRTCFLYDGRKRGEGANPGKQVVTSEST